MAKKKRRQRSGRGGSRTDIVKKPKALETGVPLPDRRAMERITAGIGVLLGQQDFKTAEEADEFLKRVVEGGMDADLIPAPANDLDRAQDRMYDAWEAPSRRQRIKLAREALTISLDCADAYVLLAEDEAKTAEQALELYQKGVEAGERALGPDKFAELGGHFWGWMETRPYMRARAGLAQCLWDLKRRDEAIEHGQALLELNPNDNQGIRMLLAVWLLQLGRNDELGRLLERYPGDGSLEMMWATAVRTFRTRGPGAAARRCFRDAVQRNPHIVLWMTGAKAIPKAPPSLVAVGSAEEAVVTFVGLLPTFASDNETWDWVDREVDALLADFERGEGPAVPETKPKRQWVFERDRRH